MTWGELASKVWHRYRRELQHAGILDDTAWNLAPTPEIMRVRRKVFLLFEEEYKALDFTREDSEIYWSLHQPIDERKCRTEYNNAVQATLSK